jgi:hypothetical protein
MSAPASITITPVFVADLLAEGKRMPVHVHVIDHPDARVLVDTGMTELHPGGGRPRSPPPGTSTTAAATISSPAGRSTSSVGS